MRKAEAGCGQQTILVVEDTEDVRRMICQILEQQGYRVLEASNGLEALEMCSAHADSIQLLITDVLMPRMNGSELAERIRQWNPRLPMIFMSGYADDHLVRRITQLAVFLAKPFTSAALTRKIREVLDSAQPDLEEKVP